MADLAAAKMRAAEAEELRLLDESLIAAEADDAALAYDAEDALNVTPRRTRDPNDPDTPCQPPSEPDEHPEVVAG